MKAVTSYLLTSRPVWEYHGTKIGLTICEDAWNDKQYWERPRYQQDPVADLAAAGAELLISINGSPYPLR